MARRYTEARILDYLDNCVVYNPGCFFMDLEHGYFHTANSRLSLFADDANWAIVFEKSGYANRTFEIELELNFFGSDLRNLKPGGEYNHFTYNSLYLPLVDEVDLQEISSGFEEVSSSAAQVRIRDEHVSLPGARVGYARWVPEILDRDPALPVTFADLGRYLSFEYEELCRATPQELQTCLSPDLPLIMQIDEWHHRSYDNYSSDGTANGHRPGSYETFPLIAGVLVSGDPTNFRPTLPPTSHWSNWPEAGRL